MASDAWLSLLVSTLFDAPVDWGPELLVSALNGRLIENPSGSTRHRRGYLVEGIDAPAGVRGESAAGQDGWRAIHFTIEPSLGVSLKQVAAIVRRACDEFDVLPPQVDAVEYRWKVAGGRFWVRERRAGEALVGLGLTAEGAKP